MNYEKQNKMLAIFKCLANVNRLKILQMINSSDNKTMNVNEIYKQMEIAQPTISDHLKLMRMNKVVSAKQDGNNIHYSIKGALVLELINRMK